MSLAVIAKSCFSPCKRNDFFRYYIIS